MSDDIATARPRLQRRSEDLPSFDCPLPSCPWTLDVPAELEGLLFGPLVASQTEHGRAALRHVADHLVTEWVGDVARLAAELRRVDAALRDAGIDYPLGSRGVRDLATQRDGHLAHVHELESQLAAARLVAKSRLETLDALQAVREDYLRTEWTVWLPDETGDVLAHRSPREDLARRTVAERWHGGSPPDSPWQPRLCRQVVGPLEQVHVDPPHDRGTSSSGGSATVEPPPTPPEP